MRGSKPKMWNEIITDVSTGGLIDKERQKVLKEHDGLEVSGTYKGQKTIIEKCKQIAIDLMSHGPKSEWIKEATRRVRTKQPTAVHFEEKRLVELEEMVALGIDAIFSSMALSFNSSTYDVSTKFGRMKVLSLLEESIFNMGNGAKKQTMSAVHKFEQLITNGMEGIIEYVSSSTQSGGHYELAPEWRKELIDRLMERQESGFFFTPLDSKPIDWEMSSNGVIRGGDPRKQVPFVKNKNINSRYHYHVSQEVLDAVNIIQQVPFRVNEEVLLQIEYDYREDTIPLRENFPEFKLFESAMGKWNQARAAAQIARKFIGKDIYFPQNVDYRGRMYPLASIFSPQGNDISKGMLEYADEIQLTDDGLIWVYATAASLYGFDKLSVEDRYAEALFSVLDWNFQDADEPYQFLQYQNLIKRIVSTGDLSSNVTVPLDGSCNGLQHLAAMTKDKKAGKSVNLTNTDVRYDIYIEVADMSIEPYRQWAATFDREAEIKKLEETRFELIDKGWLKMTKEEAIIDRKEFNELVEKSVELMTSKDRRKIAKRPVMIYPYAGTQDGSTRYTAEFLAENGFCLDRGIRKFFAHHMTLQLRKSIVAILDKPEAFMKLVKKQGGRIARSGKFPEFTTPDGFRMVNEHYEYITHRLKIQYKKEQKFLQIKEKTKNYCVSKIKTSLSPNIIHSLDATHLRMTVRSLAKKGIDQMWFIHDSFGTNPNNASVLAQTIREEFVSLYDGYHVADLIDECLGAKCPSADSLDINEVMNNQYFFS
jgi:hypothetical protein